MTDFGKNFIRIERAVHRLAGDGDTVHRDDLRRYYEERFSGPNVPTRPGRGRPSDRMLANNLRTLERLGVVRRDGDSVLIVDRPLLESLDKGWVPPWKAVR